MSNTFQIQDKTIGGESPCFVIAEIGLNHNGDMEVAKKLIDAAKEAGADCAKFQKRDVANLAIKEVLDAPDSRFPEFGNTYRKIREHVEFSEEQYRELKIYCDQKGIIFMCTAFDVNSADFIDELGVPAFKVASHSLTNLPLLEHIARKGKPMLISTGMSTIDEIDQAVKTIKAHNIPLLVFHCISSYPLQPELANLRIMQTLQQRYPDVPIGYSGHEVGIVISLAAVALGAKAVERHITLDRNMMGFDHKLSVEPEELKRLVQEARIIEKALGSGERRILAPEWVTRRKYHVSIVSVSRIPQGTIITRDMLTLKNPGTGLESRYLPDVIGKRAIVDIKEDTLISFDQLA